MVQMGLAFHQRVWRPEMLLALGEPEDEIQQARLGRAGLGAHARVPEGPVRLWWWLMLKLHQRQT